MPGDLNFLPDQPKKENLDFLPDKPLDLSFLPDKPELTQVAKLPEGLEYNPKTGEIEEKGLEPPGFIASLLNPAEWVGMGGAGAIVAKRLGQPVLKTAIDWAAQGIPALARGGAGLVKGIKAGLKAPFIERAIPVEKAAPITYAEAEKVAGPLVAPSLQALEATVKGGQVGPLPKYAEKSSINLERLETTDDVKHFLNDLTQELETKIGKKKITWEETRRKAEELGWDINKLQNAWRRKGSFSSAEIEASRQLNINAVSDLHEMLRKLPVDRAQYTPEMRAKLLDALQAVKITSQASSEAGRALNIHRKILARDESFKNVSEINRVLKAVEGKGIKRTDDVLEMLKGIDFNNPAEVNKVIYDLTKTKWEKMSDGAYEIWINNLLSHPLTHIVNTTSNTLTLLGQYPERALGAGIERIRAATGILGGRKPERFIGETAQDAFSVMQGLKNGIKRFLDTMKTGRVSETKLEAYPSALPEAIRKWTPGRALAAEDEFFKSFIQNAELNRLAYRKASELGLKGKVKADKIIDLLKNPTEDMLQSTFEKGKYLTYQSDLGKIGNWIMRGRESVPGLKYFIPFVRTPLNIAKFGLERTPLNIGRIIYKASKGEMLGGELSEEVAKVLTGSLLGAGSYLLASEGHITGGGPKDFRARDELFRTGWMPYSVKIGDNYYSYSRLEPLASILGVAADFSELQKHLSEDEKTDIASAIGGSIAKNYTSKTFVQGFSNLNDAISDPGKFGEKFIGNLAGSVVPSIAAGVTRAVDPELREARTILDKVRARVPAISETLTPKIDVWGNPIERPGTPVSRFISPVQISETKGEPIDRELVRLKLNLGFPSKRIGKTELEAEDFRRMVAEAGKIAKPELNRIIQSAWYLRLSDEEKEREIRKVVRDAREEARDYAEIQIQNKLVNRRD